MMSSLQSIPIKIATLVIVALLIILGFWYTSGIKAKLALSQEFNTQLTENIKKQQAAIKQLQIEQQKIKKINKELNVLLNKQKKDLDSLRDRFTKSANGTPRNFGETAATRPDAIQRAINRGSLNALRCLEIASGAPLTETEKNATKLSEINKECPSLANPNYKPPANQ
jgi:hypothetical protein